MCIKHGTNDSGFIEELTGPSLLFNPDNRMTAIITENEKAEQPTLAAFISAQSTDAGGRISVESVEKVNTPFYVERNEVLVRVSTLNGVSWRGRPAFLRSCFRDLCL